MSESAPQRFVTGGSGFIGGRLLERLSVTGVRVRARGALRPLGGARSQRLGAEPVRGELGDRDSLPPGPPAAKSPIISPLTSEPGAAARSSSPTTSPGPRTLSPPPATPGSGRFVHCGTEAALLAGEPLVDVDETAPLRPDSKALLPAATKALAELAVRDARRRVRDRRRAAAVRLGQGRHHPAARDDRGGRGRPARVDRRRRSPHRRPPTSTTSSRAWCSPPSAPTPATPTSLPMASRVVFREFVSDLLRTQGVEPPTRSIPAGVGVLRRRRSRRRAGGTATWRRAAADPVRVLALSQECTIDIGKARGELGYEP